MDVGRAAQAGSRDDKGLERWAPKARAHSNNNAALHAKWGPEIPEYSHA